MNGIHDIGGMDGLGPVVRESDEPVFHQDWEGRMFAINNLLIGSGLFNVDEFRHAIERIPAPRYLDSTYYEKWLDAVQTLLVEKGVVSREEFERRGAAPNPPSQPATIHPVAGEASGAKARTRAKFRIGDKVIARNLNPSGHIRLPRYTRGRRGVIRAARGVYVLADASAHGGPAHSQHVYSVSFEARELWGVDATGRERVYIDLWEDYLSPDKTAGSRTTAKSKKSASANRKRR